MEELKKATQNKDTIDSKKRNFPDSIIDDDETCENIFEFAPDFSTTDSHEKPSFLEHFGARTFTPAEPTKNFEERCPELHFGSQPSAKPTKEFKEYIPNLDFDTEASKKTTETFEPKVGCGPNEPDLSYDPFEDDY